MKKLILAAAAAGALSLGALSFATPSFAAAGAYSGAPAAGSNVIDVRCWRNSRDRLVCNNRRVKHCWWHRGHRICRWR
ncbi:MAG TPA: hypothetical protein VNR41_06020 [Xanthobacteraceae bacterium]|jgi:hypothetical protein|nr:hypothetical protein [Xanthobacteraceae bacterium]